MRAATRSEVLEETDVRAMVHLLGVAAALPDDHASRKQFMIRGLCDLVGADKWAWALFSELTPGQPPVVVDSLHGGFDQTELGYFIRACKHPKIGKAAMALDFHDGQLAQDPALDPLREKAGVGAAMMSTRPVGMNLQSAIGIYRKPGRPDFTPRESLVAQTILSEVDWLHDDGWGETEPDGPPHLSRRQCNILDLLLNGSRRNEIAGQLELSINTVNGYVKELYLHFQVGSQAKLQNLFQRGDGAYTLVKEASALRLSV